jgi:hypothetical protein
LTLGGPFLAGILFEFNLFLHMMKEGHEEHEGYTKSQSEEAKGR